MSLLSIHADDGRHDNIAHWAQPVTRLQVSRVPTKALNLNVDGRQVAGVLQGFGQMWQKSYWVCLDDIPITPATLIRSWKENFSRFWPTGNCFYGSMSGIAPGDVAVLNLAGPGGLTGSGSTPLISTGIMVIYADDESFTFMSAEGHMFAGWVTFSAHKQENSTVAQVQLLVRASDPLWEIVMRLFGYRVEDIFWIHTLKSLAAHFGVDGQVQIHATCMDAKLQWAQAKNIWHNAAIRTAIYVAIAPLRRTGQLFKRVPSPGKEILAGKTSSSENTTMIEGVRL